MSIGDPVEQWRATGEVIEYSTVEHKTTSFSGNRRVSIALA
jgi:hypothetical protein